MLHLLFNLKPEKSFFTFQRTHARKNTDLESKKFRLSVFGKGKELPRRLMVVAIFIKVKKKLGLQRSSDCKEERA